MREATADAPPRLVDEIPERCASCPLWSRAFCGALPADVVMRIDAVSQTRRFERGVEIMAAGEPVDYFANILSGVVKLSKLLPDGRQQILGLRFPGDFLGRSFRSAAPYTAEAATPVELCGFPRAAFETITRQTPELEHFLYERALDELDAARDWLALLGRKTASERLATFLLSLVRRSALDGCAPQHSPGRPLTVDIPLTRAEIADYLGLTVETVSRQFTKMRAMGLIDFKGAKHVLVHDVDALAEATGDS